MKLYHEKMLTSESYKSSNLKTIIDVVSELEMNGAMWHQVYKVQGCKVQYARSKKDT